MKFKPAPNSLFAILLRSPWWASFAVVGAIVALSFALLRTDFAIVGALTSLPFVVIGCMAAWRQWRQPSPVKVAEALAGLAALPSRAASERLQRTWERGGYRVQPLGGSAADWRIERNGRSTLVSARRWKAATHGVEPLRELHAAMQREGVDSGLYLAGQGTLSDSARIFARDHGITVLDGDAIGALLIASR